MKPLLLATVLAATAVGAFHTAPVAAQAMTQGTPSQMVLANSQRVLETLDHRRAEFSRNHTALNTFIASEFTQMFDRDYAARLVLGRHGRGASDADIHAFANALADNLMNRYGSSLLGFNTKLTPRIKSEMPLPNNMGVNVNSELLRQGGEPIPLTYSMHRVGGTWKVFDIRVENISMVQTFRNQFDAPLQQKGLAKVTEELRSGTLKADAKR